MNKNYVQNKNITQNIFSEEYSGKKYQLSCHRMKPKPNLPGKHKRMLQESIPPKNPKSHIIKQMSRKRTCEFSISD